MKLIMKLVSMFLYGVCKFSTFPKKDFGTLSISVQAAAASILICDEIYPILLLTNTFLLD